MDFEDGKAFVFNPCSTLLSKLQFNSMFSAGGFNRFHSDNGKKYCFDIWGIFNSI